MHEEFRYGLGDFEIKETYKKPAEIKTGRQKRNERRKLINKKQKS